MDNYSENKTNQTIFGVTKSISQFLFKLTAIPLSVILMLMLSPVVCTSAFAQGEEQQEETHAHASSLKWKGLDVDTVIDNSKYDPLPGENYNPPVNKYPFNNGKKFFLYNVGTGRFVIEGGNFGMEGRLFHETFGRPLYLYSDGFILSGIKEPNNNQKFIFGCNIPKVFHGQQNWNNWNQYSFSIMMDADRSLRSKVNDVYQGWKFQLVENTDPDTHTYYMYEEKNGNKYFLGAAYGECHASAWKGIGTRVHMDDDRATWTSEDPRGDLTKYEVNGDMITLDELYQWRLVDEAEFISMLDNEDIGLNPSVSIFINDRDFTRNSQVFSDSWLVEEKAGADYTVRNRLGYTYGSTNNKPDKQKEYNNEAWNKPIRLKHVFEKMNNNDVVPYEDGSNVNVDFGWKNAKYGFLTFEGVGRTYTEVEVPRAGWYLVQCYGFVQSDEGHEAYLFAKVKGSSETSSTGGESKINLKKVDAGKYTGKNVRDNCLAVGKELTKNGDKYKNAVWICVTEDQFESGVKTLQIGVGKDQATQSAVTTNGGKNYYYDTDWVCVDDFRMSYLGLRPAFFYEEEEDLDYLIPSENNGKQYWAASPTGQYGGTVCIERSLKTDQWNSFSFPMPVTGEQMRYAFGEDAQLARIDGIGTMSGNPNVIDFKKVSLRTTDAVVEPGHFYMLKPTLEPIEGYDPQERTAKVKYYELGRFFFSVNENEPDTYTHERLSLSKRMDNETQKIRLLNALDGVVVGKAGANYVQTPGFADFQVNKGIYTGTEADGIYAPKGSYVVSNNTIYHLNKDTMLKGFRGWIDLSEGEGGSSKEYSMDVFGMFEEPVGGGSTGLPRIQLFSADESVYDLFGRKVGTLGSKLPKGIYIVKGKKFLVK